MASRTKRQRSKKKPPQNGLRFFEKVAMTLARNASARDAQGPKPIRPSNETELAEMMGVNQSTLNRAKHRGSLTLDMAFRVGRVLGISLDVLANDEREIPDSADDVAWKALGAALTRADRTLIIDAASPEFFAAARAFAPTRGRPAGRDGQAHR